MTGKKVFYILIILSFILAVPSEVPAEEAALPLERARELALLNSRSLARYNLAIQSSELTEKTQYHRYMPSLSLDGSAGSTFLSRDGFSQDLSKDFSAEAGLGLSYSLSIWDGGKNSILKAINSLNTEMSRQDALEEYYNVLDSADTAYYSVLEKIAALEAAESSLETAVLSLSIAEIRRGSGMISDAVYLQALAEKASKETARNQSRRTLSLAKLELKELLGIEALPNLEPVDFSSRESLILLLSNIDEDNIDPLFGVLWKQMQARNPSMIKAAISSERTGKNLSLAYRDYSPTLDTSVSTGLNYSYMNGLEPTGRLSVTAKIPLDLWVTASAIKREKIAGEQAALDYRGALSSLDMELHRNLLDLISQAGQIVSSGQALDYARKNFDYALELYRLSGSSIKELSDAENLYRSSANQLSSSQYAFLTGLSKIRSIGVFDSEEEVIALINSVLAE